jgi:hypothetical protein
MAKKNSSVKSPRGKTEPASRKKSVGLSKSKFCLGVQCLKALYLKVHEPELAGPIDPSQQMIFDQGTAVGIEARKRFPKGVLIEADYRQSAAALAATEEAIAKNPPAIFEAALSFKNVLIRIDILRRNRDGTWDIVEVKSSTDQKDEHIPDLAIQRYVAEGAGLKISRTLLMHLNRECVFPDLENLFKEADCTAEVDTKLASVPKNIKEMNAALALAKPPIQEIGPHCDTPYECAFKSQCWDHVPAHSVFELNGVWTKDKFALYKSGTVLIADIEKTQKVSRAKPQQLEAVRKNNPVFDKKGLAGFLKKFEFPIYFFDFETYNPAIPVYNGLRPYSQIPFQFSCHVLEKKNVKLKHFEYLADGPYDPREEISEKIIRCLGREGTILAYNDAFEKSRIKELAEHLPKKRKALLDLSPRFVDLKDAFSNFYYHPEFHGSFSIKDVLPVLVPSMSYEEMPVADGGGAQVAYLKICNPQTDSTEKEKWRRDLLKYCQQDTLAMVELYKWIQRQIE